MSQSSVYSLLVDWNLRLIFNIKIMVVPIRLYCHKVYNTFIIVTETFHYLFDILRSLSIHDVLMDNFERR